MFYTQFNRSVTSRGSRGSDEPSILNSFLPEPAIYTSVKVSSYLKTLEIL